MQMLSFTLCKMHVHRVYIPHTQQIKATKACQVCQIQMYHYSACEVYSVHACIYTTQNLTGITKILKFHYFFIKFLMTTTYNKILI